MEHWIIAKFRKDVSLKSPDKVWVCMVAGQHLARQDPSWLWSPPEWAQSQQQACLLPSPWRTSSCSLHGSYLTNRSLPESLFTTSCIMALSWFFYYLPRRMATFPHGRLPLVPILARNLLCNLISNSSHNEQHLPVLLSSTLPHPPNQDLW